MSIQTVPYAKQAQEELRALDSAPKQYTIKHKDRILLKKLSLLVRRFCSLWML
jgi:hypothetical protein